MKKISKARRAHLLARMTEEERQQSHARFMRRVCAMSTGSAVLPKGATVEFLTIDTSGGTFAIFETEIARVNERIAKTFLTPVHVGSIVLYTDTLPHRVIP